jgi:hypothetical protein
MFKSDVRTPCTKFSSDHDLFRKAFGVRWVLESLFTTGVVRLH